MKNQLIYVPLEHIDQRYTVHMDMDIRAYLDTNYIDYHTISPPTLSGELPKGMFLDAAGTIRTKAVQINQIARLYQEGLITNETTFFFSDLWFPGIESLAYLNYFYKVNPKITGIIHAGSFTDTDFVRDMERWAKNFEDVVFDICDTIFVASEFIKQDIIKKRLVSADKLVVAPLPLDSKLGAYKLQKEKENIVIFNGRLCDEKQPEMFDLLAKQFEEQPIKFIKTQDLALSKHEYYQLLNKSKAVVSFALQENFGFGIAEAVDLGCVPIVPNKLVYPEMYSDRYRYDTFQQCVELVSAAINNELKTPKISLKKPFDVWFKNLIS